MVNATWLVFIATDLRCSDFFTYTDLHLNGCYVHIKEKCLFSAAKLFTEWTQNTPALLALFVLQIFGVQGTEDLLCSFSG